MVRKLSDRFHHFDETGESCSTMFMRMGSREDVEVVVGREEAAVMDTTNIQDTKSGETDPLLKPPPQQPKTIVKRFSRPCSWNWKNLLVSVCLWLTYAFCSIAYSIIAPFFPVEVRKFQ